MPRGSNTKREREYDELKRKFKKSGRYRGREEEVAARIVNKQRAQYGETKDAKRKARQAKSPDKGLPVADYQHLTTHQVVGRVRGLSAREIRRVRSYEQHHKNRKTLVKALDACLSSR